MPVRVEGNKIIEISTNRVVGVAKTHKDAQASARIRNAAHAQKKGK